MSLIDFMQRKRKLKNPQVRRWTPDKKGEWGFHSARGTKTNLALVAKKKSTSRAHYAVAYKGREYSPKEFLKKYPKYKK